MNRPSILVITAIGVIGFSTGSIAQADEMLKFRAVMHATFAQSQEIGDVEGHASTVARFSGLASLPDGSVGTTYFVGTTDYTRGAGTFSVHQNLTLGDGSVLWWKAAGTATVDGTKTNFNGNVTVLGGKGRFEGAKGDGTVTGTRFTPLTAGAELFNDLTINIKK